MSLPSQLENGRITDASEVPFEIGQENENGNVVEPMKQVGMRGVRFATFLMLLFWTCCIILRNVITAIDLTSVKCGVEEKYASDPEVLKDCVRHTAIFRMAAVLVTLLVAQALLSLFFVNKDSTALWDDWWILVKYPFVVLRSVPLCVHDARVRPMPQMMLTLPSSIFYTYTHMYIYAHFLWAALLAYCFPRSSRSSTMPLLRGLPASVHLVSFVFSRWCS